MGCLTPTTQDLSAVAWAFAKVGHLDAPLFATLARVALKNVDRFIAPGLAKMVWAFVTSRQSDSNLTLLKALAGAAVQIVDNFSAQHISNVA